MTVNVPKVNPGDLIAASSWNLVVDTLVSLQDQIDAIGVVTPAPTGKKPVITSTEPTPDVPAGSTLTIHGQNFEVPAILNTVTLGGAPLEGFVSGSTDQILKVQIPGDIAGPLPQTKELILTTTGGDAKANVHVVPTVVTLIGAVQVKNVSGTMPAPTVGDTLHFEFTLDADAVNIAEQYHVRADFSNAVGSNIAAWQSKTTYVGLTVDGMVTVDPAEPATVGIDVVVPTAAKSVDMTVSATSLHNDPASSGTGSSVPIVIGTEGPAADPSIHLGFGSNAHAIIHSQDFTGPIAGTGLAIQYGKNPVVELSVGADHGGTYTIAGAVENPDVTIWALAGLPQSAVPYSDGQTQLIHFNLHLVPAAAGAADVTRYFTLTVTRDQDDGIGQISNFFRFPIGGF